MGAHLGEHPTDANRVRTHPQSKARLTPLMAEGNRAKTAAAPAVAVLATDRDFHQLIPRTFPNRSQLKETFADETRRHQAARFNATLQDGYFILAVRAAGLAAGPMLGYDADGIDREFFDGTSLRSVLVVNIGHPGDNPWFDRLPRLPPGEVVTFL
jgi:3-hydroxypropanoate dehydrogenase